MNEECSCFCSTFRRVNLCKASRHVARGLTDGSARRAGAHPGRRAQPHRAGHRVRLLLLPRILRAEVRCCSWLRKP